MKDMLIAIISVLLAYVVYKLFSMAGSAQFYVAYLGGGIVMWIISLLDKYSSNKKEA